MVHFGDDDDGGQAPNLNDIALDAGLEVPDLNLLDDETQRFVLETHMENIGVFDFLGFELASLVVGQYDSSRSKLPQVGAKSPGKAQNKMGDMGAYVTLFKSFVGIGILSLPYAMSLGGYIGGPVGLVVIAILAHYCMQAILETSDKVHARVTSFGGLAMKTCGRWAKVVVEASLVVTQYGFCIAYVIFITENVRDVVCLETQDVICPRKEVICMGLVLMLQPLSWLRSLNVLAIPTLMSNFVLLGGLMWVIYCASLNIMHRDTEEVESGGLVAFNWAGMPLFFGMAVFTFEGICLVLPIKEAMANPARLPQQLREVMILLVTLFVGFGMVGYVSYRGQVNSMITFNLPNSKITSFMRLFYCLGLFFTYPVCLHPVHCLNESKYKCLKGPGRGLRRLGLRSLFVFFSGCIALSIPHFGLFLGLLGSLACAMLAFVLPALFHYRRLDREDATTRGDVADISLVIFGLVAGAVSFSFTMEELVATVWMEMHGEVVDAG